MRSLALCLLVSLATAAAGDPAKPDRPIPPNPSLPRQGGDAILDAFVFHTLTFTDTGTTTGYHDDYDEVCPYGQSTSPDVVYHFAPEGPQWSGCAYVAIDLWGSTYDTKVYVYDENLALVACNDDYYSNYVSRIESVGFRRDVDYFIMIDGYGGDHGDYVLNVSVIEGCYVDCAPGWWTEDEAIADEVPDTVNGGCDVDAANPAVMPLPATGTGLLQFCGSSGWRTVAGEMRRDFDWFSLAIGAGGTIEGVFIDELGATVQVIAPGPCGELEVQSTFEAAVCAPNPFLVTGDPGAEIWLRIATPDREPPCYGLTPQSANYQLELDGLQQTVAVQAQNWSAVKGLFRGRDGR